MTLSSEEIEQLVRRTFARVDPEVAQKVINNVTPVWYENTEGNRHLVGTAFFAAFNGRLFVITAEHNFSRNPDKSLCIVHYGEIRRLNQMAPCVSCKDDLWVAEVDDVLKAKFRKPSAVTLKHDNADDLRMSTGALLIGYPQEINNKVGAFTSLPISTILEMRPIETNNPLVESVVYDFKDDFLTTVDGKPVMHTPEARGMSGGPVFGWYGVESDNPFGFELRYFLQGMITAWNGPEGYVVACNAARIFSLVENLSIMQCSPSCSD